MKDQWTAVDERFDKEFTCVVTYEKWPDEEEQRLREPQYKFKDFPNTNPKIIKNFLHSELEKVKQEAKIEGVRLVCLPVYDHSKCPLPQTCIGYQNAESDLEHIKEELINNLKTNELDKNKQ